MALGTIAFHRGEPINATWFVLAAACSYLVAYRLYSAFIAAKLLALDNTRATPAERRDDGRDFVPTISGCFLAITSLRSLGQGRWSADAGSAVRLSAGDVVADCRRGVCGVCAGFRDFVLFDPARWKNTGRDGAR